MMLLRLEIEADDAENTCDHVTLVINFAPFYIAVRSITPRFLYFRMLNVFKLLFSYSDERQKC